MLLAPWPIELPAPSSQKLREAPINRMTAAPYQPQTPIAVNGILDFV
jgi:hypothetical protein